MDITKPSVITKTSLLKNGCKHVGEKENKNSVLRHTSLLGAFGDFGPTITSVISRLG